MNHSESLRSWAKGSYPYEAAVELLLRGFNGKYATPGNKWVLDPDDRPWIDFEALGVEADNGPYSGGERRFLLLAASIAGDGPVVLGDVLPGLDRVNVDLVLAACAHAAGSHEHSDLVMLPNGQGRFDRLPTLYPWPANG
jgi:hypothetical protein